jgi:hypothetical protein
MSEQKPPLFSKKTPARPAVPVLLDFLQTLLALLLCSGSTALG